MPRAPEPDEEAAIAAAIERFRAETAAAGRGEEAESGIGPWQRAALAEGVGAKGNVLEDPEGGLRWLS